MIFVAILFWGLVGVGLRYMFLAFSPQTVFPWAVLLVNSAGSFAAGFIYANDYFQTGHSFFTQQVLLIGLLGGLTTFSALTLDTMRLFLDSQYGLATLNILLTNGVGLGACFLGIKLAQATS